MAEFRGGQAFSKRDEPNFQSVKKIEDVLHLTRSGTGGIQRRAARSELDLGLAANSCGSLVAPPAPLVDRHCGNRNCQR
jgi:hypothetical protein